MFDKIKIVNKKVLKKTPFLEFVQTNYMNTHRQLAQWVWCRRPKSRKAVVIIAVVETPIYSDGLYPHIEDYDRKLVITNEYRVPIEGYELGFPAGLMDKGETPEDTVRRELEEETGLIVDEIMHISPAVLSSAGMTDEAVHLAYVKVSGKPNKDKLEASEDIDTYLLEQTQIQALLNESFEDDVEYTIGKSAYSIMRTFAKFGDI